MQEEILVKIPNFKLFNFKNLIEQALIVGEELILEFSPKTIRSITYTSTKSFMKLWIINMIDLIENKNKDKIEGKNLFGEDIKNKPIIPDFPLFDFYILKGSLIRKLFKVHTAEIAEIQFDLVLNPLSNKYQARSFSIISESQAFAVNKSQNLKTSFPLSTEELMTNKIDDYSKIISKCQPTEDMNSFVLEKSQIQEVKRLIKNLHKVSSQNKVYLNFQVDIKSKKMTVTDSIFSYEIELDKDFKGENFSFNILKSDFIITGNHTLTLYTNKEDQRLIMGTTYLNSIIWSLMTKIADPDSYNQLNDAVLDNAIEGLNDLEEYFPDDVAF